MHVLLQKIALGTGKQPRRAWVEHDLTLTAGVWVRPIPQMGDFRPAVVNRRNAGSDGELVSLLREPTQQVTDAVHQLNELGAL
jgi:hypothetical protein